MAELVKRSVKVIIDKQGAFRMEAGEGLTGENCQAKTKNIELFLGEGATETGGGRTDAYYDGSDDAPISINLQD